MIIQLLGVTVSVTNVGLKHAEPIWEPACEQLLVSNLHAPAIILHADVSK